MPILKFASAIDLPEGDVANGAMLCEIEISGSLTSRQYGSIEVVSNYTFEGHLHRTDISGYLSIAVDTILVGRTRVICNGEVTIDTAVEGMLITTQDGVVVVDTSILGYAGFSGEVIVGDADILGYTGGSGEVSTDVNCEGHRGGDGSVELETSISAIGFRMQRDGEIIVDCTVEGIASPNVIVGARCHGTITVNDFTISGQPGHHAAVLVEADVITVSGHSSVDVKCNGGISLFHWADISISGQTGYGIQTNLGKSTEIVIEGTIISSSLNSISILLNKASIQGTLTTLPLVSGSVIVDTSLFSIASSVSQSDILRFIRPDVSETVGVDEDMDTNPLRFER